jgi:pimeloyl-ACP methyl ester carboxylesterase
VSERRAARPSGNTWRLLAIAVLVLFGVTLTGGCAGFHGGALPNEPKNARFMQLKQARVRYLDSGGDGPAVVLLHGFASSLDAWKNVVPTLRRSHRVVALDLKGFGWSSRPEGDYSPAAQAELVFELMDKLGVEHTSLVAHSWGSSIALQMALMQPKRLQRIALYDAFVFEEQIPTHFTWSQADGVGELLFGMHYTEMPEEKMAMAFYDERYLTEELIDSVHEQLDRPGTTAAALAAVRGQRFGEVELRYRDIRHPVLLLWGREDRVTPLEYGERLLRELPNARLAVYPQCGHFPMIEAVRPSTAELRRFLVEGT